MSEADRLPDDEFTNAADAAKASRGWLAMIEDATKAFRTYQDKSDAIDRHYASLDRLAGDVRDRELQVFWANIQTLAPSIYARAPVPVAVPRFQDRRPLYRVASELLERASTVALELGGMDVVMRLVRDDLAVLSRGVIWLRYEVKAKGDPERVCIDHADRKDFLHEPARSWPEVGWVAKRSWMTRSEMRKRFAKTSGRTYQDAAFGVRKDGSDNDDGRLKAGVWEIWHKPKGKVVWVAEGCDKVLDEGEPHLDLSGFFPCPRPAYGTIQRRSLIPVPDFLQIKGQLEEINELTARMSALAEAIQLRGFYPAGAGEISDAIESAMKRTEGVVTVPISNWAMIGGGAAKDMFVWLPLVDVVTAFAGVIKARQQVMQDLYEITGLSDLMRGQTDPDETLGAQQLKGQYGSVRIRDRQEEMIRLARDTVRIAAEIMAENFSGRTLLDMSLMQLPTEAENRKQIAELERQAKGIQADVASLSKDPRVIEAAKAHPQEAQHFAAQAQEQLHALGSQVETLKAGVTIDDVVDLLRDQRIRPFAIDIETDSTIAPDENAQKKNANEFILAVGGFMGQALPLVQAVPQATKLACEFLKLLASKHRAGRQMLGVIDEFAEEMEAAAGQPKPPDPAHAKAASDAEAAKADLAGRQADAQTRVHEANMKAAQASAEIKSRQDEAVQRQSIAERELQAKEIETQGRVEEARIRVLGEREKHAQHMEKGGLELQKMQFDLDTLREKAAQRAAETQAAALAGVTA